MNVSNAIQMALQDEDHAPEYARMAMEELEVLSEMVQRLLVDKTVTQ